jgi:hypothetical protein
MSGNERRKSPRYAVEIPARLSSGGGAFPALIKDICRDAVLLESHRGLALDSAISLAMELPGGESSLNVLGRVIRVVRGDGDAHRLAVLFTDVNPAAATAIDFFLALQD